MISNDQLGLSRRTIVPMLFTASRAIGIWFLAPALFTHPGTASMKLVLGWVILALTDLVDGLVARKFGGESPVGRVADPLADKVLVFVSLFYFCLNLPTGVDGVVKLTLWVFIVIRLIQDSISTWDYLKQLTQQRGSQTKKIRGANWWGKGKVWGDIFAVGIGFWLVRQADQNPSFSPTAGPLIAVVLLAVAALCAEVSLKRKRQARLAK